MSKKINRMKLMQISHFFLGIDPNVDIALVVENQLDKIDKKGCEAKVIAEDDNGELYYTIRIFDKDGNKLAFFRDYDEDVATLVAILKLEPDFDIGMIPWE